LRAWNWFQPDRLVVVAAVPVVAGWPVHLTSLSVQFAAICSACMVRPVDADAA
jgi:hypothetical protein